MAVSDEVEEAEESVAFLAFLAFFLAGLAALSDEDLLDAAGEDEGMSVEV